MILNFNVGDIVQLKKKHPCGEDKWEVMRTGVDYRIKCLGCGRQILIPRIDFRKRVKKIIESKN